MEIYFRIRKSSIHNWKYIYIILIRIYLLEISLINFINLLSLIDYETSFYVNYQWINYYNAIRYMSIINNLRYWNGYFQNFVSFWANFFDLHHGFHYTRDLLGKFLQQSSERYTPLVSRMIFPKIPIRWEKIRCSSFSRHPRSRSLSRLNLVELI